MTGTRTRPPHSWRSVLEASGLCKAFEGHAVLEGVDLELAAGKIVLLRGENGTGKTTLINLLSGQLEPDAGRIELGLGAGRVFAFPQALRKRLNPFDDYSPEHIARAGLSRSWQEVRLFPSLTVEENIVAAAPSHPGEHPITALLLPGTVRRAEEQARRRAQSAADVVRLTSRLDEVASTLSFGDAKRTAIARALEAGTAILLLDEPLSGLDDAGAEEMIDLIERSARRRHLAVVIVEHAWNVGRVLDIADRVWTLAEGRLVVESVEDVRAQLHTASPPAIGTWLDGLIRSGWTAHTTALPSGATLRVARPPGVADPVLEVDGLTVVRGGRRVLGWTDTHGVLEPLSFTLHAGDVAVLEAPNGWGKSTLLGAVMGMLAPERGSVRIDRRPARETYRRVRDGVVFMRPLQSLFPRLTIRENLRLYGQRDVPDGFDGRVLVGTLSGGERQRLAWSIMKRRRARVLLLDEPFTSLDSATVSTTLASLTEMGDRAILMTLPTWGSIRARDRP